MNTYSYNDNLNQIKKYNDDKSNEYLDSKIKYISELFGNMNNTYIYNIYSDLCNNNPTLKINNTETIIFIIFIFIKEKHINDINDDTKLSGIYKKYSNIFKKIHHETNNEFLCILFLTYFTNIYNSKIYDILKNL
jgi:hypothetical protein